ncbi:hypothetical protein BGX26_005205 [Mortierella sp. AD094]|nr:hypothetical protein BGX26_005205 [Mortierella sp. AD094]
MMRSLYEYIPNSGWSLLSDTGDVPPARKSHCMVPAYGGSKMIVFGGIDQSGAVLGDIYSLDMATLIWTKGNDGGPAVARADAVCAVTNDLMVVWGGCDSKIEALSNGATAVYNLKQNIWQSTYTPLPDPDPATPPSTASSSKLEAIIGGIFGGVAVIALTLGLLFDDTGGGDSNGRALMFIGGCNAAQNYRMGDFSPVQQHQQYQNHLVQTVESGLKEDQHAQRPTEITGRAPQIIAQWNGYSDNSGTARNPQSI